MALTGEAKTLYQRRYMRRLRAEIKADEQWIGQRERYPYDQDVLRLANADFTDQEIRELLDISEEALRKALARVADYLCPTAASEVSVNPRRCEPLEVA